MEEADNVNNPFLIHDKSVEPDLLKNQAILNPEEILIDKMFKYQQELQERFTGDLEKLDTVIKNKLCRICFLS